MNSAVLAGSVVPLFLLISWLANMFLDRGNDTRAGRAGQVTAMAALPPLCQGVAVMCLPAFLQLAIRANPDVAGWAVERATAGW